MINFAKFSEINEYCSAKLTFYNCSNTIDFTIISRYTKINTSAKTLLDMVNRIRKMDLLNFGTLLN